MFSLVELAEHMDSDLHEIHQEGHSELAEVIAALAKDIRAEVRRERFRGKAAEEEFYRRFNASIDPYAPSALQAVAEHKVA